MAPWGTTCAREPCRPRRPRLRPRLVAASVGRTSSRTSSKVLYTGAFPSTQEGTVPSAHTAHRQHRQECDCSGRRSTLGQGSRLARAGSQSAVASVPGAGGQRRRRVEAGGQVCATCMAASPLRGVLPGRSLAAWVGDCRISIPRGRRFGACRDGLRLSRAHTARTVAHLRSYAVWGAAAPP